MLVDIDSDSNTSPCRRKMKAIVISLPSATDRREFMKRALSETRFEWEFSDAKTAKADSNLDVDQSAQIKRLGRKMGDNEVGCFKSHISALQSFDKDPELDWLFVLEDDVILDCNFDVTRAIEEMAKRNIDYVRLYAKRWKKADASKLFDEYQLLRFRTDPYGTQAYLINRNGARAFLDSVTNISLPIDDELGRFWDHGLDIFCIFPFPAIERSIPSGIRRERPKMPKNIFKSRKGFWYRCDEYIRKYFANLSYRVSGKQK